MKAPIAAQLYSSGQAADHGTAKVDQAITIGSSARSDRWSPGHATMRPQDPTESGWTAVD